MDRYPRPIINLNGDTADTLIEQCGEAWSRLDAARVALLGAMPHGRNYQLQASDDFRAARAAHITLIEQVEQARDEMRAMVEDLMRQRVARGPRRSWE